MNFEEIKALESKYMMQTYGRHQIAFDKGEGATLWDTEGKKFIDLTSGIGVNCLGHNNPALVSAVCEQAGKLMHACNIYYTEPMVKVAEKLVEASGMKKIFFANSGAEANEGMIKIARKYSFDKYGEGRNKIITLTFSFHGRTITTLKATGQEKFHKYFFPFTEGFDYVPANDIEALKAAVDDTTCAIMLETIQGEGGVLLLTPEFLKAVEAICQEKDILFLVDEVQTGIGRTGNLLSFMEFGIKPDVCSMAKGLAGGVPVGAVMAGEKCADVLKAGDHGTTFGGNPIAMAAANVVLDTVNTPEFLQSVKDKGDYICDQIASWNSDKIEAIRHRGLMIGIQVDPEKRAEYVAAIEAKGVIVLTAGASAIRLLPPLVITKEEIDEALAVLKEVLA